MAYTVTKKSRVHATPHKDRDISLLKQLHEVVKEFIMDSRHIQERSPLVVVELGACFCLTQYW